MTNAREKRSLGRGLRALIPEAEQSTTQQIVEIDVSMIDPNPMQPRKKFDTQTMEELKNSIIEVGVLSPILVQKDGERYKLIAGERRLHASKLAGRKTIPCVIRDADSEQMLKIALIENIQRDDLNVIELAYAYQKLRDEFYLTQNEIAQKVGKSRSVVANTLRLLELSQNIQEAVRSGEISPGHARALLSLDEDRREMVLEIIRKKSLSVRDVEKLARIESTLDNGKSSEQDDHTSVGGSRRTAVLDPNLIDLLKNIEEMLRTKVEIRPAKRSGGGKFVIHYYGDDDLVNILTALARLRSIEEDPD